ncbi:MAG: hypothetical protein RMK97_07580 [Sutterellaceae bacterium]|nr:hypothetical protein [Burkholderiaceae bacterium]MCX7901767.1 hypothetical protein [Burkholderiaceae bacterium]MDW8430346.1 hypothetical protein [Sutterellaceae bacterium]
MIEPQVHIAYAPRGAGLLCAMFWFTQHGHVYGWYTGARGRDYQASYFVLEQFEAARETVFYRSVGNDLRGRWVRVTRGGESPLANVRPVPEALAHELAQLQEAFARHWLLYRSEAQEADIAALQAQALPLLDINVHPQRLAQLHKVDPLWTYSTPGADLRLVAYLGKCWSLNYAPR